MGDDQTQGGLEMVPSAQDYMIMAALLLGAGLFIGWLVFA